MSQEKVDKYKEEKKNRKKTIKLQKIKKALIVLVLSLGVGALIGIPLGKYIYKVQKEIAEKNKTIVSTQYNEWFENYWNENYGYLSLTSDLQKKINEFNDASLNSESDASSETDSSAE